MLAFVLALCNWSLHRGVAKELSSSYSGLVWWVSNKLNKITGLCPRESSILQLLEVSKCVSHEHKKMRNWSILVWLHMKMVNVILQYWERWSCGSGSAIRVDWRSIPKSAEDSKKCLPRRKFTNDSGATRFTVSYVPSLNGTISGDA